MTMITVTLSNGFTVRYSKPLIESTELTIVNRGRSSTVALAKLSKFSPDLAVELETLDRQGVKQDD